MGGGVKRKVTTTILSSIMAGNLSSLCLSPDWNIFLFINAQQMKRADSERVRESERERERMVEGDREIVRERDMEREMVKEV